MNIVSRQQWGAKPPRSRRTITLPTRKLFLHHTAGSEPDGPAGVRSIQSFHMGPSRGWADIAYSFLVDRQGTVFEGRGAGVAGAHTQGHNTTSHAICVVGHYDQRRPTSASLDAVAGLVRHGHERGWWPGKLTGGHRDVGSTSCPGKHLYAQIPTINRLAQEDDMSEKAEKQIAEIHDVLGIQTLDGRGRMQATEGWNLSNWLVKVLLPMVQQSGDPQAMAELVRELSGDEIAEQVADELYARLRQ